jgi:hypothetical protein
MKGAEYEGRRAGKTPGPGEGSGRVREWFRARATWPGRTGPGRWCRFGPREREGAGSGRVLSILFMVRRVAAGAGKC